MYEVVVDEKVQDNSLNSYTGEVRPSVKWQIIDKYMPISYYSYINICVEFEPF